MLILKLSLQIDAIIAATKKVNIKATSITLAITDSEILVLYTRNPTAVYRSIHRRSKRQKRLNLRPKTATPATSKNALAKLIYSI
jgi:hypothetical protein